METKQASKAKRCRTLPRDVISSKNLYMSRKQLDSWKESTSNAMKEQVTTSQQFHCKSMRRMGGEVGKNHCELPGRCQGEVNELDEPLAWFNASVRTCVFFFFNYPFGLLACLLQFIYRINRKLHREDKWLYSSSCFQDRGRCCSIWPDKGTGLRLSQRSFRKSSSRCVLVWMWVCSWVQEAPGSPALWGQAQPCLQHCLGTGSTMHNSAPPASTLAGCIAYWSPG